MSSQTVTVVFIAVIAALMAAGFILAWWRDQRNADEVVADPERLDTAADPVAPAAEMGSDGMQSSSVPTTTTPH